MIFSLYNKNRDLQAVKLQVPFLLSAAQDAVPNAPCAALLDAEQTLLHPTSKGERNGGMEFCSVCPELAGRDLADATAFFWCNAVRFV